MDRQIDVEELIADARRAMEDREPKDTTGWFWVARLLGALESSPKTSPGVSKSKRKPEPCSTCGVSFNACTAKLRSPEQKTCCPRCEYTDTHNVPPGYYDQLVSAEKADPANGTPQMSEIAQALRPALDRVLRGYGVHARGEDITKRAAEIASQLEAFSTVPVQRDQTDDRGALWALLGDTWDSESRWRNVEAILAAGFTQAASAVALPITELEMYEIVRSRLPYGALRDKLALNIASAIGAEISKKEQSE